ncbi:hypothetical protein G6011_06073 [Alternaria panax]|uniref:Uncharacterized protein n=1 Tax=Alternaria panax TaxID=48097 RepID=A0AAD4FFN8_9PLEO|nr:hypothetical protein G6011_06073 [Alternaria panax]
MHINIFFKLYVVEMAEYDNPLSVGVHESPLSRNMTTHELLITIATASPIIAISLSLYLVYRHLTNYTQPKLQKLIIRTVLMVPIYTIWCTLRIPFYASSVYIGAVYEFYESLVIASFFLLLCQYLHADLQSFCVIKFFGAHTKRITKALDVDCKTSNDPDHAQIWIQVIEIISLVTAMICLLQFYKQDKLELAVHRPLFKFVAFKLLAFLFYVQTFTLSHLTKNGGAMSPADKISYPPLAVGTPKTLLCFEMALVSIFNLYAYPYDVFQTYKAVDDSDESGIRDNHN